MVALCREGAKKKNTWEREKEKKYERGFPSYLPPVQFTRLMTRGNLNIYI